MTDLSNITTICSKYNCTLLSLNSDMKIIQLKSSCGHICETSVNKFKKHKIGVHCHNCLNKLLQGVSTCIKCNNTFKPTQNMFLYCCIQCSNSRQMTQEKKDKISTSLLSKNDLYKNIDGSLKSFDEIENIKKKRNHHNISESLGNDEYVTKKPRMLDYNIIKKTYEDNGCTLLTTELEYIEHRKTQFLKNILFKIVSSCGHEYDSLYYGLVKDGTGKICKTCKNENMKKNMTIDSKTNGHGSTLVTQKHAIDIIKEKCKNMFHVKKVRDGCACDILVKPINELSDNWLQVKIKASIHKTKYSGFRVIKKYDNVVFLMVYTTTHKCWIIPPDQLEVRTYHMETNEDKYAKFHVDNLNLKFLELYNSNMYNSSTVEANTPISDAMKIEYKYVIKRENTIGFLNFKKNDMTGLHYNFKIGNFKVQESVCSKMKHKNAYYANLSKNCGKNQKEPYSIGDNDIYWINLNNYEFDFYVVPEHVLVEQDYIKTKGQNGNKYLNVIINRHWLEKYKFNYNTINNEPEKKRLLELIKTLK